MATYFMAPSGSDGNPGTINAPWRTFDRAVETVAAGDTLFLRGGTYANMEWHSRRGGTPSAPITITRYQDEVPRITGGLRHNTIFEIVSSGHGDYIVDGLVFENITVGNVIFCFSGADRWTIRNCTFRDLRGNAIQFWRADKLVIEHNTFDGCGNLTDPDFHFNHDNMYLRGCTRFLVRNNRFSRAEHYCFDITRSTNNVDGVPSSDGVVKDNVFDNTLGGGLSIILNSRRILVEGNVFRRWGNGKDYPKAAIDLAGPACIIRRNRFVFGGTTRAGELGTGPFNQDAIKLVGQKNPFPVSQQVVGNRIYHNTVYRAGEAAVTVIHGSNTGDDTDALGHQSEARSNLIFNNVFYRCHVRPGDSAWGVAHGQWYVRTETFWADADNKWTAWAGGNKFFNNIIRHADAAGEHPGEDNVIGHAGSSGDPVPSFAGSLADVQALHPLVCFDNLDANPAFADEAAEDFRLRDTSPAIDAGAFLAFTRAAGENTTVVPVSDALGFSDGFGVIDGDEIQFGNGLVARVVRVDITTHTLTVDRPVSFAANEGVHLRFNGRFPDLGAFEAGEPEPPAPEPPPAPTLDGPLIEGDVIVSGTGVEGALVAVVVDGVLVGTAPVEAGVWALTLASPLEAGARVSAVQVLDGLEGPAAPTLTVQAAPPPPDPPEVGFRAALLVLGLSGVFEGEPPPPPIPLFHGLPPPLLFGLGTGGVGDFIPIDEPAPTAYSGRGLGRGIVRGVGR